MGLNLIGTICLVYMNLACIYVDCLAYIYIDCSEDYLFLHFVFSKKKSWFLCFREKGG